MNKQNEILNFINKFKNEKVSREMILGLTVLMMMNKSVFEKNVNVSEFIEKVFYVKMPNYATKSRTLMVAKVCRLLTKIERTELFYTHKSIVLFLYTLIEDNSNENDIKNKKSKNALSNMNKWFNGILDKNE
ncbi:TPA: hypothetical protein ACX6PK_003394 [Photobacterium damselae]